MPDRTLSVYESADWWARLAGVAHVHYGTDGILFVNEVAVESIRKNGHFAVLSCVDGSTTVVLSSFLRLVPDQDHQDVQADPLLKI